VRIGIISPYSLTMPGGVQGQILGLARVLRQKGHETRVLGPCDGPPPDAGVTPLGNSLPTSANGSMAPIAPDIPAQIRTIRALRDEAFDVVHLHEPLAPGPTATAMFIKTQPLVGTFHAAGGSLAYEWLRPGVRWLVQRLDVRCAVSEDAKAAGPDALGGEYVGSTASRWAPRPRRPAPKIGPTVFFVGRHEPRKGLDVLLSTLSELPADVRLWIAGDGPTPGARPAPPATRVEWLGRVTGGGVRPHAGRTCSVHRRCAASPSASCCSRRWRRSRAVASDLPGYANGPGRTRCAPRSTG
jgi:phosphatidylinositol alpha-mannosyltransferase